jgi:hypothetical protein
VHKMELKRVGEYMSKDPVLLTLLDTVGGWGGDGVRRERRTLWGTVGDI